MYVFANKGTRKERGTRTHLFRFEAVYSQGQSGSLSSSSWTFACLLGGFSGASTADSCGTEVWGAGPCADSPTPPSSSKTDFPPLSAGCGTSPALCATTPDNRTDLLAPGGRFGIFHGAVGIAGGSRAAPDAGSHLGGSPLKRGRTGRRRDCASHSLRHSLLENSGLVGMASGDGTVWSSRERGLG